MFDIHSLSIALKEEGKKQNMVIASLFDNVRDNDTVVGCSGYVKDVLNGTVAYINTKKSIYPHTKGKMMYKLVKDEFSKNSDNLINGQSRYANEQEFVYEVVQMLKNEKAIEKIKET